MANAVVDYVIYSDLRFTKCASSFQNASDDDLYIYLYDVPGAAKTTEGQSCSIEFGAAEYTGSSMACNEAAKMMSFEFGTYAPICNENTPEQWEQCQCGYGDYRTEATCVCVDVDSGVPLEDGEIAVIDTSDSSQYSHYSEWCEDHCPNNYYPGLVSNAVSSAHSEEVVSGAVVVTKCVGEACSRSDPANKVPPNAVDWSVLNTLIYTALVTLCAVSATLCAVCTASVAYILRKIWPRNGKYQSVAVTDASDTECV